MRRFTPTAFRTGAGTAAESVNAVGQNEGACKTLAFAQLHGLSAAAATALFAQHAADVAATPGGSSHKNIRGLAANGWAGVRFEGTPLRPRA